MLQLKQVQKYFIILLVVLITFLISNSKSIPQSLKIYELQPEMILIPGGEFLMGKNGDGDYSPAHTVYVDSFFIDKYEVTNSQYFKFCKETDRQLPEFWGIKEFHCGLDYPNHPVVGISWYDANAYAKWAGKRLPSEAEWEYAARGSLIGINYPNGTDIDTMQANFIVNGISKGTVPIGNYRANGYGLYDMAGNVVEWVSDYYDKNYYKNSPDKNPMGPEEGKFRVIRGGGWHSGPFCNRVYFRNGLPAGWLDFNVGFRCAKNIQE